MEDMESEPAAPPAAEPKKEEEEEEEDVGGVSTSNARSLERTKPVFRISGTCADSDIGYQGPVLTLT